MGRKFQIYKTNKKKKSKPKEETKRIIGELPSKIPIYGSKSLHKYNYMDLSPLDKRIIKNNNFKKIELSKFPRYDENSNNNHVFNTI